MIPGSYLAFEIGREAGRAGRRVFSAREISPGAPVRFLMHKSDEDSLEDFCDVYDFSEAFDRNDEFDLRVS